MLQCEVNSGVFENNTFETIKHKWRSAAKRFPVAALRKVTRVVLDVLDRGEQSGWKVDEDVPTRSRKELVWPRNEDVAICADEHIWIARLCARKDLETFHDELSTLLINPTQDSKVAQACLGH